MALGFFSRLKEGLTRSTQKLSEGITTVALAVKAQLTVDTLAETGAVNPSVSESLQRCAERAANARMARAGTTTRVA